MKYGIPKVLITVVLLGLVFATAHGAERVYKWVDENGVTHFSSTPPPEGAERVKINRAPRPSAGAAAAAESAAAPQGELYADAVQPDNSAIEAENARRQCEKGRNMIAQIEPRPRVFRVDADGTRTYLEDEERMELLDEARSLVSEFCDS
ncbi:MAG: DUF4124 domain-containing protein [Pseudomonadota bacterium]